MFERVLVVCVGNVCRSPVAEAMLRRAIPGLRVESAGLGALEGQGVDPTAREIAEADGLEVAGHTARQVTRQMIQQAQLILVMSERQRHAIAELSPEAMGKTMLLGKWLAGGKGCDIPDPYRKDRDTFARVHGLLREATDAWVARLPG